MEAKLIGGLRTLTAGNPEGPAVVLFHGYCANAEDLYSLHRLDPKRFFWVFPEAPLQIDLMPGVRSAAWFHLDIERTLFHVSSRNEEGFDQSFPPDLTEARQKVSQFLTALHIPPSRLILGGFSQGAMVATELALSLSENIQGLLLLSGTLILKKRWELLAKHHAGLRFFQSHGKEDDVLPVRRAKNLYQMLTHAGLIGSLHLFEGGHEIPGDVLGELRDFIQGLIKTPS